MCAGVVCALAQGAPSVKKQSADAELKQALAGMWVGTLEYRDYSEPAESRKRVKLPTWLSVELAPGGLRFRYTYDDGPTKVVTDEEVVRIDTLAAHYETLGADGKVADSYSIAGLDALREGRGVLMLTGKGTENDATVDVRTTLRIGRNILEMTRETAAAGQPMSFRHAYTLVRSTVPQVPAK
ncbi:MAG: hypothetical protein M3O31_04275 [Acidobacteriota bacterium]|nr:hypothetical protein [Acidobacteriota bacterium]